MQSQSQSQPVKKTADCRQWVTTGFCQYGDRCHFSHLRSRFGLAPRLSLVLPCITANRLCGFPRRPNANNPFSATSAAQPQALLQQQQRQPQAQAQPPNQPNPFAAAASTNDQRIVRSARFVGDTFGLTVAFLAGFLG